MTAEDSTIAGSPPARAEARPRAGLGLYLVLLTVQTIGAAIVLGKGVPIYRRLATDFASHEPQANTLWWAVAAVVLIQCGYWLRVKLAPPLPGSGHVVIGHLAAFVARLSFILASSTFTVVFLLHFEEMSLPPRRVALLLALLFSMYCWTLELERLAKALHGTESKPAALEPRTT